MVTKRPGRTPDRPGQRRGLLRTAGRRRPPGPVGRWLAAFGEVWSRAERRGEVRPGITGTTVAATASALVVQRWLFGAGPVDEAFADQVLADVVLPLVTTNAVRT